MRTADALIKSDPGTLGRLLAAEVRGHQAGRLGELYGLVGDSLQRCEARLPELLHGAPQGVLESTRHLLSAGGKRVRPLLLALSAGAAAGPAERPGLLGEAAAQEALVRLMAAAELTHSATLLHDDVLDDAELRRGRDTARVRWGNSVSVLAGDFLLTRALEETLRSGCAPALPALIATIRSMIEGEALQLSMRGKSDASRATYDDIVGGKTASLFAFCGRVGALLAGAPQWAEALESYARQLGFAFQIVDDVLDVEGDPAALGKSVHADVAEGKLTLPVILALEARPELRPLLVLPADGDHDRLPEHTVALLCRALQESAAAPRARAEATAAAERSRAALRLLPEGPCREALWLVAQELVTRNR